jgi:hypothetical protein
MALNRRSDHVKGLDLKAYCGRPRPELLFRIEEGQLTDDQFEFMQAVDEYKRLNGRPFLRTTEYLEIAKFLGYRKTEPRAERVMQELPTDAS